MASNSSEPDPKVISSIVDRLKKQGLFDTFRKECLADVDTKPAYQNLRHRTEVAVARFLSTQTWRPDLNKNQLRDSVRKHINESAMMYSGIDRVVEQVVNPKIYRIFKPQIDRVVCEFLGIDPDERERKLKQKEEEQRRQRMQVDSSYTSGHQQQLYPPGTGPLDNYASSPTIPSLFDIRVPYVPRGTESPTQVVAPMNATGGSTVVDSNVAYSSSAMYAYPGGVQYGYPSQFPGMTQQYVPGYTAMGLVPTVPQYPMLVPADVIPQPLVAAVSPVVVAAVETKEKERKPARKKKPEPLTVEELLNIPLPPNAKEAQKVEKNDEVVIDTKDDVKVATKMTKLVDETKKIVVSVASPKIKSETSVDRTDVSEIEVKSRHTERTRKSRVKVEKLEERPQSKDSHKSDVHHRRTGSDRSPDIAMMPAETIVISDSSDVKTESVASDVSAKSEAPVNAIAKVDETAEIDGENPKVYHFAWDAVDPGCVSGVSSVHTSDLSSFDDGTEGSAWSSDDDVALKTREEVTVMDDKPSVKLVKPDVVAASTEDTGAAAVASEMPAEGATVEVPRQKPRRLISLQYNYSDSDEEETREEKKARIAREIEQRYLRRQQRRAELEAKRKDREEERAAEREQEPGRKEEVTLDAHDEEPETPEKNAAAESKPRKQREQHRTKENRKKELREQKVMEKTMALRRQRTRNRRYTSDEFTTFFSSSKRTLSNESYTNIHDTSYSPPRNVENVDSPPTPTQDERFAYTGEDDASRLSIPIYEVTTPHTAGISMGKFVHMTRSNTKKLTLDTGDEAAESGMPYSDVSSDALSFSGSSVDSKTHHSPAESKVDVALIGAVTSSSKSHEKSAERSKAETPSPRVRRKSSGDQHATENRPKQSSDASSTASSIDSLKTNVQRYAISDLYKPHHSRVRSARRSSSPTHVRPRTPESERGVARRRAPIGEVNFGEAAKKSRQQNIFGGAERRTNMPLQRYSQLTRHEAKYGSSGKNPGERGDRTPTLEPSAQSGSSYWSAREEKLKASSALGSRTKSLSQDDDDVTSKGRSRSRSQSDWQSEESATSSERKSAKKRRRRKTDTSSGSEYSSVVRERRMSRSSSGGEDVYLASLSRQGEVGSSLPERERLSEESSDDEPLVSTADRRGSTSEAPAEQRDDKSEDILSSQAANVRLPASFAAYGSDVRNYGSRVSESGTDCEDEIEPAGNHDRTRVSRAGYGVDAPSRAEYGVDAPSQYGVDAPHSGYMVDAPQSGYGVDAPQQEGEIQVELWQGSEHWNLSVENVGPGGNRVHPSLEVISAQEPVSNTEVVMSDQVDASPGQVSADQEYQVFYDKPDDASEDIVKGTKRPRSPDTDEGSQDSMPSKRMRSESSCSEESVNVAVNIETTSPVMSPRESFAEDETSSSSSRIEQTESHTGNYPERVERIFQEQLEEQRDALITEVSLCEDNKKDEMQPATEAQTSDVMDSDVVDVHRDGDKETEESTAHSPQPSDESESSVECEMSPNSYAVSTVVDTQEVVVKSAPEQHRTYLEAATSDAPVSAEVVSPSFDRSAVAHESLTPLLTPQATEVTSFELERTSSIPQTGETSSSSSSHSDVVTMETTAVAGAIEEEELVRSPEVISMVAEEERSTATECTEDLASVGTAQSLPSDTAAQADNDTAESLPYDEQMDAEDKPADEGLATENIGQYSTHDIAVAEVPSHPTHDETEQKSDLTRQTCISGITSQDDGSDGNEERLEEEGSEQNSDRLHLLPRGEVNITSSSKDSDLPTREDKDTGKELATEDALLPESASIPSTQNNIAQETVQMIEVKSPSSFDIPSPNKLTLEDQPDSLLGNVVADSGESAFVVKHSPVDDIKITSSCSGAGPSSEMGEHVGNDHVKMTQSYIEPDLPSTEDEPVGKDLPIDDIEMTDSDLPTTREDAGKELPMDDVKMTENIESDLPISEDERVEKDLPGDDVKMIESTTEEETPTTGDEDVGMDLPRGEVEMTQSSSDPDLPTREDEDVGKDFLRDDVKMTESDTDSDLPAREYEDVGKNLPGDDVNMTPSVTKAEQHLGNDLLRDDVELTQSATDSELPTTEDEHMGKDLHRDDAKMTQSSIEAEFATTEDEDVGKELARGDVEIASSSTEAEPAMQKVESANIDLPIDDVKMTQSSTEAEFATIENEHAGKELARDDAEMASSCIEATHPSRKFEQVEDENDNPMNEGNVYIGTNTSERNVKHVEKPVIKDSVKVTPRNTKAVEVGNASSQPDLGDVEKSFDEGASETGAKSKVGSQNKSEANKKECVPDTKKESVPDTKKESVPEAKKESVPDAKKESVPDTKKESVPDTKKESVPDAKKEHVPDAKKESVPDVKKESVPGAKKESVPDTKKESVPDTKKESVPDAKKESVRDAKKESVPDVKKESVPDAKKESVLDAKKESVPDAKKESVQDANAKKESVPVADASIRSVSQRTKGIEVKPAAPMAGRRKSQRSTAGEHHKFTDTRDHDLRKSTESDRPQSASATTREMRGRRAGATPPEGSTREPRKSRRAATPPLPPLRSRRQSGGSVEAGPSVSSTGRKPTKAVVPPSKAVAPPAVKGKVDNLHVTRSMRKKSQEASLPIAKRLRR